MSLTAWTTSRIVDEVPCEIRGCMCALDAIQSNHLLLIATLRRSCMESTYIPSRGQMECFVLQILAVQHL